MSEAKPNPVPVPQPEPEKSSSSESSTSDVRTEAGMHTPKVTGDDLLNIAHKIRYDLDSARAKLIELQAYITALNLPTTETPFSEERFLKFVGNTAHIYTDESIADEIRTHGGDEEFVQRALELAAVVRRRNPETVVA